MNRLQMIRALARSKNTCAAGIMKRLLNGTSTLEQEQCMNHGSFVTAVLKGDYETALAKADSENKAALLATEKYVPTQADKQWLKDVKPSNMHPIFEQILKPYGIK